MAVHVLTIGQVATGVGTAGTVEPKRTEQKAGIFQVSIAGVATVELQGRLTTAAPWETVVAIDDTSTDQAAIVTMFPQIRANVTSWTRGAVGALADSG